jgi:hypothetical protein
MFPPPSNLSIGERLLQYAQQPFEDDLESILHPTEFVWKHSVTPGSHVLIVLGMVVAYVATSFLIRSCMANRDPFSMTV